MLQNLLETWLDSASERSYQNPFCQLLIAEGYTVLHSTRHTPIEYGKDILARAKTGEVCAFQLKGNPGGRLTLGQYREITSQLIELATQPVKFPGTSQSKHFSYLVTNGQVEEEVQKAVEETNEWLRNRKAPGGGIIIWSRGHILDMALRHTDALRLTEWADFEALLRVFLCDGSDEIPREHFDDILRASLFLNEVDGKPRATDLRRAVSSSAIMTAVALRNFSAQENYWSEIQAWSLYYANVIGALSRWQYKADRIVTGSLALAEGAIFKALDGLAEEVQSRRYYIEGDATSDCVIYHWRQTLLISLVSIYWIWCEREGLPKDGLKKAVEVYISNHEKYLRLWGEGAFPQFLAYLWYLRNSNPTNKVDAFLQKLASDLIEAQATKRAIPSPYYSFEEVVKSLYSSFLRHEPDPIGDDSFWQSSFFVEPTFDLLVRSNLKQTCKALWPSMTRIGWKRFIPSKPWEYCVARAENGEERMYQPKFTEEWDEVVRRARHIGCPEVPQMLQEKPVILLLYTIVNPNRATPNVVRFLDRKLGRAWFIGEPIEEGQ